MWDHELFDGPWVQGKGEVPTRIILHAKCDKVGEVQEYIVHRQYRNEKGELHLENGDYFPKHYENAFNRALDKFHERCKAHYHEGRKFLYLDQPDDEFLATLASDPNEA